MGEWVPPSGKGRLRVHFRGECVGDAVFQAQGAPHRHHDGLCGVVEQDSPRGRGDLDLKACVEKLATRLKLPQDLLAAFLLNAQDLPVDHWVVVASTARAAVAVGQATQIPRSPQRHVAVYHPTN